MTVSNGQLANQNTFNTSFMSREQNTDTIGKVDLLNTDPASGASTFNIQRFINSVASVLGMTTAEAYNFLLTYSSNVVGAPNDTVLARLNALTQKFRGGVGLSHTHSGVDGQGEKVSATDLLNINQFAAEFQAFVKTGVTGGSTDISLEMGGKVPGGLASLAGVITDPPNNKVALFDSVTGQAFEDAQGQKVFGRLTWSAGVWTVTYYTNEAGVETPYSFGASSDVQGFYLEVFTLATRPTIPSTPEFGSLDITGDVVDASATQRGVVNTSAQTFAGIKSFNDGIVAKSRVELWQTIDSTTTGVDAVVNVTDPYWVLTNVSLSSISGIIPDGTSRLIVMTNKTGNRLTLKHEDGAALANERVVLPDGSNLDWPTDMSLTFIYDINAQRWSVSGGGSLPGAFTNLQDSYWWGIPVYGIHAKTADPLISANGDVYKFGTTNATIASDTVAGVLIETGSNIGNGGPTTNYGTIDIVTGAMDGAVNTGPITVFTGEKIGGSTGGDTGQIYFATGGNSGPGNTGFIGFATGIPTGGGTRGDVDFAGLNTVMRPDTTGAFIVTNRVPIKFTNGPGAGDNHVGFRCPTGLLGSTVWNLPQTDGLAGQKLTTDGSANLSWSYDSTSAEPVRVASLTDIALTGLYTLDGYGLVAGDRVLVAGQNVPADNGIYVAAAGAWSRATDMDATSEVILGKSYYVRSGAIYGQMHFAVSTVPAVLGVNTLTFDIVGVLHDLSNLSTTNINVTSLTFANTGVLKTVKSADVTSGNSKATRLTTGTVTGGGASGGASVFTGNSDGNSGDVTLQTGTATGTRGNVVANSRLVRFVPDLYAAIENQKALRFYDSDNSNYAGFKAHPTTTADVEYVLPPSDGSANQVLKTDGAGNLGWSTPGGGSVTFGKESFTLVGGDITNQWIDLSQVILANSLDFMFGGLIYQEGVDYTVNLTGGAGGNTRITFAGDLASVGSSPLAIGDVVYVKYNY